MHHQKGIAIHLLIEISANVDGKFETAHGGINVHGHGLRCRPGHARLLAGYPNSGAIFAETARIHEQHEGSLATGQKDFPLQFDQFGVDLAGPDMAVFRLVHGAFKVQDDRIAVFVEKLLAFGHRRGMRRTCGYSAVPASQICISCAPIGIR